MGVDVAGESAHPGRATTTVSVPVRYLPDVTDVEKREVGRKPGGDLPGMPGKIERGSTVNGGGEDGFGDGHAKLTDRECKNERKADGWRRTRIEVCGKRNGSARFDQRARRRLPVFPEK